jgi:hypothetical protein
VAAQWLEGGVRLLVRKRLRKGMLKENMVDRMNLFITKGASLLERSRKEQSYEEISLGIAAYEASSSVASPAWTFAQPSD